MSGFTLIIDGIKGGSPIPEQFSHCAAHNKHGGNKRPAMHWSGAPAGTKSFAIIVVDPDVPASFELANREGHTIPASMARQNFYHWLQIDIPHTANALPEAPAGLCDVGISGRNDYGASGTDRGLGYDGPCPPWNDERMHHYHFTLYALDIGSLGLKEGFSGKQAMAAIGKHIIAKTEVVGTYTTNPNLRQAVA